MRVIVADSYGPERIEILIVQRVFKPGARPQRQVSSSFESMGSTKKRGPIPAYAGFDLVYL